MKALLNELDRRWFGNGDPRFAWCLRMSVIFVVLWLMTEVDLRYADLPKGASVSVLGLVTPEHWWSSPALLWLARIGLVGGVAGWLLTRFKRLGAWTTVVAMLLLGSIYWENLPWFRHKFICPFWLLVVLAAAQCRRDPPRWLREAAVVVMATFYAGAGMAKLLGSGLEWANGVGLQLWLLRLGDTDSWVRSWVLEDAGIAQLLATTSLGLELAVPLTCVWPRARLAIGLMLLALHLGIDCILHIDFRPQMLLVATVFCWPRGPCEQVRCELPSVSSSPNPR